MIKNQKDFIAGLMFIAFGLAFGVGGTAYEFGTGSAMGPGYFPTILGFVLAGVGVLIVFNALQGQHDEENDFGQFAWKPLLLVVLANVLFGICLAGIELGGVQILPPLGLMLGIVGLVIVSSFAESDFLWKRVLLLALVLAALSYVIFIKVLGLVLPVWPWFIAS